MTAVVQPPHVTVDRVLVEPTAWTDLARQVQGRLVTPQAPDWDSVRLGWTVNVDQRPAAVLECADPRDVVTAVRWAVRHGLRISVQPRGHAARTTLDDTLLLRTSALQELEIDVVGRTARVGAGVSTGSLLAALKGTGLVFLCGSSGDTSVVGVTLGGGLSWFSRKHGFAANSVRAFEVVDSFGVRRRIDAQTDPDLFWALRGGGGDFAVVLAVELDLVPEPEVYGGRLMFPVEHTAAVLRTFRDLAARAPRELTLWAQVFHFPPLPSLPEAVRGRSFACVTSTYLGTAAEAEVLLAPLRACAPVVADFMRPVPVEELDQVAAEPTEPMPSIDSSALLVGLDDDTIDRVAALVADPARCPMLTVQVRHLGGACAEQAPGGGAVRAPHEEFSLLAIGVPAAPGMQEAIAEAWRELTLALDPVISSHRLPNFTGAAQDAAAGYDDATLRRLRRLKEQRDPFGTIRSNRPVLGS
jgi:hypothetical protein